MILPRQLFLPHYNFANTLIHFCSSRILYNFTENSNYDMHILQRQQSWNIGNVRVSPLAFPLLLLLLLQLYEFATLLRPSQSSMELSLIAPISGSIPVFRRQWRSGLVLWRLTRERFAWLCIVDSQPELFFTLIHSPCNHSSLFHVFTPFIHSLTD